MTLARRIVQGPDGLHERTTTSRQVTLDWATIAVLVEHRQLSAARAAKASAVVDADGWVFSSEVDGSRPWRPDSVTHAFTRLCKRAGVNGIRLHDLRHLVDPPDEAAALTGLGGSYRGQTPEGGDVSTQHDENNNPVASPPGTRPSPEAGRSRGLRGLIIDGLTDEEEQAFLDAIAQA